MPFLQPPPELGNQYEDDRVLRSYLRRVLPDAVLADIEEELQELGALAGGELYALQQADRLHEPTLTNWSPWGERIDAVAVTRVWEEAERLAAEYGLIATAYEQKHEHYSRIHQFALAYLFAPATDFYSCSLAMTDGAARTLLAAGNNALLLDALPQLTTRNPDYFWTSGQWMTERVGGSDVSQIETIARQDKDGVWRLYGEKWFVSGVTSQIALVLARPEGNPEKSKGLALFYVVLRDDEGRLQNIRIERLKDKLGTRKIPTAEVVLDGTPARPVHGLRDGVRALVPMLTIARAWNAVTAVAFMRRGLALARNYAHQREVFGKTLAQQPLHADTFAHLQAIYEGAFHLAFRVAELLGETEASDFTVRASTEKQTLLRILTPIAKLTTGKQAMAVLSEVIEVFGGAGYVEDTGLPALLRDAQVLPIWEGTTNVLALDTLRAIDEVGGLDVLRAEMERCAQAVSEPVLSAMMQQAQSQLEEADEWLVRAHIQGRAVLESGARRFALALGHALEQTYLACHAQWAIDHENDARAAAALRLLATAPERFPIIPLDATLALANDTPLPPKQATLEALHELSTSWGDGAQRTR
jgi:alkylation response protein AidB-like acyl-CoA dehydrogenase